MLKSRDSFKRTSFKMNVHAFVLLVFICTIYGCDAGRTDKKSSKLCQNILVNMEKNSQSFARLEATVAKQLTDLKSKQDTLYTTMRMIMLKVNGNLALNRKATQSSTYEMGTADKATDGNDDGIYLHDSCTHTQAFKNSWWRVDLEDQVFINKVVITNREDCCGERLHDLMLTVSNAANGEEVECGQYKGPSTDGAIETIRCAPGTMGRFLKIQINGTNQLTLCEVEVY